MKQVSTLLLKAVLVVIGAIVLIGCVWSFPYMWAGAATEIPAEILPIVYIGILGIYAAMFPFLFALLQAFTLLQNIDRNHGFSVSSVKALKIIKYCAVAMTFCYAFALPFAFLFAEADDAPGVILIATALAGAPLIVATFAAVLQMLIQSAIDMKTEHDLTV